MSEFIYADMEPAERLKLLQRTALRKETMEFSRTLSETDLVIEKDLYCRDGMRISTIEGELEVQKANLTGQIKAIKATQTERLKVIASERRQIFDDVYLVLDTSKQRVNYYDKRGELVHSRNMNDEERQVRMALDFHEEPAGPKEGVKVSDDITDIPHEEVTPVADGKEPAAEVTDEVKPGPKKKRKGVKQTPDNPSGQE